ncbi:hypothetical protein G6F31_017468 [Rhizopus arrhizus]|nr:hypothetical protein G6F31_017468 [Rhizopus arrhizus]
MKPSLLATGITLALALASLPAFAAAADDTSAPVKDLDAVTVHAQLDQARNMLSPDIGSSQYQITAEDIQKQPLGASAPLSQVLLQAPGVVQDSTASTACCCPNRSPALARPWMHAPSRASA